MIEYDFNNFTKRSWTDAWMKEGTIRPHGHGHICAMMAVSTSFTAESYRGRCTQRAETKFDIYGRKLTPLPKISVQDLMKLDMDVILSTVFDPGGPADGWVVEMFTNDREHPDWLALVKACPFAFKVYEIPSRMDKYNIQCWLFARKDPR